MDAGEPTTQRELEADCYCGHQQIVVSSWGDTRRSLPGVHRVASLHKRWILGTHQATITADHLQSYLEEFTFRFNRGRGCYHRVRRHQRL